jgi:ribosomal protein S18 acetylase RimI-like enzyme
MVLKKFSEPDAEGLRYLLAEFAPTQGVSPPDDEALSRSIRDALSESFPLDIWLWEVNNKLVGYVATYCTYSTFLGKPTLHIKDLFVDERHRRNGIGNALLEHCYQVARERTCGRVELHVFHENTPALRVYEANGLQAERGWQLYRRIL